MFAKYVSGLQGRGTSSGRQMREPEIQIKDLSGAVSVLPLQLLSLSGRQNTWSWVVVGRGFVVSWV
jgi:hypothetical protein